MAPFASHVATSATTSPAEQLDLFALLAPRAAVLAPDPPRQRPLANPSPQLNARATWPFEDARPLAVDVAAETAASGALTASVFDAYRPSVRVLGAQPHPTRLVESAAMAAATAPECDYSPLLPGHLVARGILSDAQLETVCRAGAAHAEHLPGEGGASGARQGFFVGDGTGVGGCQDVWYGPDVRICARATGRRAELRPRRGPREPVDRCSCRQRASIGWPKGSATLRPPALIAMCPP
ncbi:hypothetical protein BSZ36_17850 [Rubricoccus marinus]|uniref:Strawberry notch AAA domain-containing protein n=1 Tax=Rubricoccus marinus TaxID=716817 RepID=A0A259TUD0_9BACT|nr:hypothetical protein BSZ36_17850 [Rubricoccus marinus]